MSVRIEWDEHEQAVLLCALISVLDHKIERKQAIAEVSQQLRKLAVSRGIVIDDKYRNENGIALQMSKLEYAFTNGKSGLHVDSGWYFSIVRTYRNEYGKYKKMLGGVVEVPATESDMKKIDFVEWIKKNNPEEAGRIIASLLILGNQRHSNILKITDMREIESLIKQISSKKGGRRKKYTLALRAYEDYLNYVQGDTYEEQNQEKPHITAEEKLSSEDVVLSNEEKNAEHVVSFAGRQDYSHTRPYDLEYSGIHYSVRNWMQAYTQLVRCLFEDFPDKIVALRGKSIRGKRIDITDTSGSDAMIAPHEISEDLYLETNESATDIVEKIGLLLDLCGVDYADVIIKYTLKQSSESKMPLSVTANREQNEKGHADSDGLSFGEWLRQVQGMAEGTVRGYDSTINTVDAFVREHNIGSGTLRGTTDYASASETVDALFQSDEFIEFNRKKHNRFSAAMRKYLQYLRGGNVDTGAQGKTETDETFEGVDFTPYKDILAEKFPRGFRIDSRLDMGRLRNFWKEKYGTELNEEDEIVRKRISHITIRCQDFVYLPEMMMSDQTAEKIFAYLDECFKSGKAAVYFDALYTEFKSDFVGKRINNPEMLKSYMTFANGGRYYIHKTYLTADPHAEVNPADEIRDYMITIGVPVSVDDLKEALSHINADTVYWTVAGSHSAEFVRNQKGEYFHADVVRFTKQETDAITEMIQRAIDDKGYMGGKELTDAIADRLPSIMERYPFLSWLGLRDVIAYKLRDVFSFKGKIISASGQELSMSDVFAHFAATHDHFTLEHLNALKRDLDTPIYFDDVYANSLRISKDEFVTRDEAAFDIEATDTAIGRFCVGDYIALKDISFFGSFPDAGFPWNEFLLEHYVADFSKKFKLLHTGFNAGTPVGAIVKRSSRYSDFEEVMISELAESKIHLDRENALQYLVDIGLLARKNYGGIEHILSRAKLQRQRKG